MVPPIGTVATHFIPPQMPGFDAGGRQRRYPAYDFYANPNGNLALAESYLKKAGYPSGKYTGPPLLTIADNQPPATKTAQARPVTAGSDRHQADVPRGAARDDADEVLRARRRRTVAICPTVGWGKDFFDSQSMITPVFNGKNIVPSGNTNMAQANDPTFNKQMEAAEQLTNPTQRATRVGATSTRTITSQVFVVTWLWDNEVGFHSTNVNGVQWPFNGTDWDLTASSLK